LSGALDASRALGSAAVAAVLDRTGRRVAGRPGRSGLDVQPMVDVLTMILAIAAAAVIGSRL
jgi:hypothetical protein